MQFQPLTTIPNESNPAIQYRYSSWLMQGLLAEPWMMRALHHRHHPLTSGNLHTLLVQNYLQLKHLPAHKLVLPCSLASLWVLITGMTFALLLQVRTSASMKQGSSIQTFATMVYLGAALLVVPGLVSCALPLRWVAMVRLISCGSLIASETLPQLIGLGASLAYGVKAMRDGCVESLRPQGNGDADNPKTDGPPLCILIAARICNETETLQTTLRQFLPEESGGRGIRVPPGTIVMVTYNPVPTPEGTEVLEECAQIGAAIPGASYVAVNVPGAKCKADGVNAALAYLASLPEESVPEIICFMDADIAVASVEGVILAHQSLRGAPRTVVGVSCITGVHIGSWMVAVEYQFKDIILHQAYSAFLGTGWTTGNFLFLRSSEAFAFGFDTECLAEDHALMMVLAASDLKVALDANVRVMTEAPPRLMSFLVQRTRWAQGDVWIAGNLLPKLLSGPSLHTSLFTKLRWTYFYYVQKILLKYAIAFLLPCTLAMYVRSDVVHDESLSGSSTVSALVSSYLAVSFAALVTAGFFSHPWLRWYHYMAFFVLRIPYGIFNAQAPIIADVQHALGLGRWIETERHSGYSPQRRGKSAPRGWNAHLDRPLMSMRDVGEHVARAVGAFVRTH